MTTLTQTLKYKEERK